MVFAVLLDFNSIRCIVGFCREQILRLRQALKWLTPLPVTWLLNLGADWDGTHC